MDNATQHDNLPENTQSIFDLEEFPSVTKPINITPKGLLLLLEDYANYKGDIESLSAQYHIDKATFYRLSRTYEEIATAYRRAQEMRAEHLSEEQVRIADDDSEDLILVERGGSTNFMPNLANVRRSELRIKTRQYLMERYHPEKFAQRTKVEQTVRGAVIHGFTRLPPVAEIEDLGLDGLMNVQRSMRYGDGATQQSGATRR